jgi:N utilization substance protein B
MGKRRKARELALQALYQLEVNSRDISEILLFDWENNKLDDEIKDFASELIRGTYQKLEEIDDIISRFSKNWKIKRINLNEKNILRFSTYSLLFQKAIPSNVVINEAIDVAKRYCEEDSYKFINGILDEVSKEVNKIG